MGAQDKGALLNSEALMNNDLAGAMGKPVFAANPTEDMFGRNQGLSGGHAAAPQQSPMAEPQPFFINPNNQQNALFPQMSPNPQNPMMQNQMEPQGLLNYGRPQMNQPNPYSWYQEGLNSYINQNANQTASPVMSSVFGLMGQ